MDDGEKVKAPQRLLCVVGARPNFMKMAPILEALREHPGRFLPVLVHTGQHYDERMSDAFFRDLGMPQPDIHLGIGSGSHAEQTAKVMIAFETVCLEQRPDRIIVVGDVNSTLACTLVGAKLGIPVAHVEAGLRSRDMSMPEEVNRLCTDVLCDLLFTTDRLADANLRAEGIPEERIHFVGNVMIDTLLKHRKAASQLDTCGRFGISPRRYALMTLHRPANVDEPAVLLGILDAIAELAERMPVVFPIHPRTRKIIGNLELDSGFREVGHVNGIQLVEPQGYLDFMHLMMNACMVLTDSGGLQEETTVLGVPCLTLRENTERPITIQQGSNRLVGTHSAGIRRAIAEVVADPPAAMQIPERWDGGAAKRIAQTLHAQWSAS